MGQSLSECLPNEHENIEYFARLNLTLAGSAGVSKVLSIPIAALPQAEGAAGSAPAPGGCVQPSEH